jgi:hypothetical protein
MNPRGSAGGRGRTGEHVQFRKPETPERIDVRDNHPAALRDLYVRNAAFWKRLPRAGGRASSEGAMLAHTSCGIELSRVATHADAPRIPFR